MPLLFVSYRREADQDNLFRLMHFLQEALYAVWYDREQILVGDPSWEAKIDEGIERSNGVILCLTPGALESEVMQREIATARRKKKPIFPVVLKRMTNQELAHAFDHFGYEKHPHVEFFRDDADFEKHTPVLLKGLQREGLIVTPYDLRRRDGEQKTRYQAYLRHIASLYGTLQLHDINPEFKEKKDTYIEKLFVPMVTDLTLVLEIEDYHIVDSWVIRRGTPHPEFQRAPLKSDEKKAFEREYQRLRKDPMWNWSAIDKLIEEHQNALYERREEELHSRFSRIDDGVEFIPLGAFEVASSCQNLIVMGEAGVGKSAFARFLGVALAGEQIPQWNRPITRDHLGYWAHQITPVYVRLKQFFTWEEFAPNADSLVSYLRQDLEKDPKLKGVVDEILPDLREYGAILFLDGLDSLLIGSPRQVDRRRRQIEEFIQSLQDEFKGTRFVITCRPSVLEEWALEAFFTVTLLPFTDEQSKQLVHQFYQTILPQESETIGNQLVDELEGYALELRSNPRFVTLLATLYPATRGVLFSKTIDLQLDRWAREPALTAYSLAEMLDESDEASAKRYILKRLGKLAFEATEYMTKTSESDPNHEVIPFQLLAVQVGEIADETGADSNEIQKYLSQFAYVLVPIKEHGKTVAFKFAHQSFREYLASYWIFQETVNQKKQSAHPFDRVRRWVETNPDGWMSTFRWLGDVINDDGTTIDNPHIWTLLDDLLEDTVPEEVTSDYRGFYAAWLASQIVFDQEIYKKYQEGGVSGFKAKLYQTVLEWLKKVLETKDALPLEARAHCGRLLGKMSISRRGVGRLRDRYDRKELPDIWWVEVPAGEFILGSKGTDLYALPDEFPQRKVFLPKFEISKYPITYEQYEAFTDTKIGGYTRDEYWTASGLKWRGGLRYPSFGWQDPHWHISNHPVIGITWFEAYAFCRWLSDKTGSTIRLPTELEWEKTARGTRGLIYPYGNTFTPNGGNTRRSNIGRTTAVGIFTGYESPYEVSDMTGNVYQWCSTAYDIAELGSETLNLEDPEPAVGGDRVKRVLRGGCWKSYEGFARSAYRFGEYPQFTSAYWGFRVVKLD